MPTPTWSQSSLQRADGLDDLLGRVEHDGVRQSRRVVDGHDDAAVLQEDGVAEGAHVGDRADLLVGAVTQAGDAGANGVAARAGARVVVVVAPEGVVRRHPLDLDALDLAGVRVVVAESRLFAGQDVDITRRVHLLAGGSFDDALVDELAHRLVRNPTGLREGRNGRSRLLCSGAAARRGRSALSLVAAPAARSEEEGQGYTGETGDNSSCAGTHDASRLLGVSYG